MKYELERVLKEKFESLIDLWAEVIVGQTNSRKLKACPKFNTLVNELDNSLGSAVQAVVKFIYQTVKFHIFVDSCPMDQREESPPVLLRGPVRSHSLSLSWYLSR